MTTLEGKTIASATNLQAAEQFHGKQLPFSSEKQQLTWFTRNTLHLKGCTIQPNFRYFMLFEFTTPRHCQKGHDSQRSSSCLWCMVFAQLPRPTGSYSHSQGCLYKASNLQNHSSVCNCTDFLYSPWRGIEASHQTICIFAGTALTFVGNQSVVRFAPHAHSPCRVRLRQTWGEVTWNNSMPLWIKRGLSH